MKIVELLGASLPSGIVKAGAAFRSLRPSSSPTRRKKHRLRASSVQTKVYICKLWSPKITSLEGRDTHYVEAMLRAWYTVCTVLPFRYAAYITRKSVAPNDGNDAMSLKDCPLLQSYPEGVLISCESTFFVASSAILQSHVAVHPSPTYSSNGTNDKNL